MKYEIKKATRNDQEKLIEYYLEIILKDVYGISKEEKNEIDQVTTKEVKEKLSQYFMIDVHGNVIGCYGIEKKEDGILLDMLYLEESYRNQGIGTEIIKQLQKTFDTIYLWVYEQNQQAVSLYQKLGFKIIDETKTRYYMQYRKNG